MSYLPCVEVEPKQTADASVIWLHGLGANGHDFEPVVKELALPNELAIRFVFPHAPSIPVTVNGGYVMPAWYDILEMQIERKVDKEQLMKSAAAVAELVEREIERGVKSERIVIAGFSQGGAVAYQLALSYPKTLAGMFGLSTYFATHDIIEPSAENKTLPILICHGTNDPVVPEALGRHSCAALKSMGYEPEYRSYLMEHSVCMEEINDISNWLQARFNN